MDLQPLSSLCLAAASARPPMPDLETGGSFDYKGCKVYTWVLRKMWRVYPHPGKSVYDKRFSWGGNPGAKWQTVLDYCESPTMPASRMCDIAS